MLNEVYPESLQCEAFELPEAGNGYMPVVTIIRRGVPGDVMTSADRYATYREAVAAAYRLALAKFPRARIVEVSED